MKTSVPDPFDRNHNQKCGKSVRGYVAVCWAQRLTKKVYQIRNNVKSMLIILLVPPGQTMDGNF